MSRKSKKKKLTQENVQPKKKTAPRNTASKAKAKESSFTPWKFGFRYEITPDGRKILHRRKYVFEDKLKKAMLIMFFVMVGAIIAGSIAIIGLNQMNREIEDKTLAESAQNERVVSLVGMTAKSKAFLDTMGKYNGFLDNSGDGASATYDALITGTDASILAERQQLGADGIVDVAKPVNENMETTTAYANNPS